MLFQELFEITYLSFLAYNNRLIIKKSRKNYTKNTLIFRSNFSKNS